MAVDANVIIFARIKEELGAGVEVKEAIKIGFKKATSAILDGNIQGWPTPEPRKPRTKSVKKDNN